MYTIEFTRWINETYQLRSLINTARLSIYVVAVIGLSSARRIQIIYYYIYYILQYTVYSGHLESQRED